ncbi:unnamed protein product, partial [Prorocentrum cordatum]
MRPVIQHRFISRCFEQFRRGADCGARRAEQSCTVWRTWLATSICSSAVVMLGTLGLMVGRSGARASRGVPMRRRFFRSRVLPFLHAHASRHASYTYPRGDLLVREAMGAEEGYPEGPERAMFVVSELKASAALFAAFAFGALNLPSALTISEFRITSSASSVSTSRPAPDSDLLQAFVVLDVLTLGFMLICVVVSQLLMYRLSDGSYGSEVYGTDEEHDPRDSALGRLATQYGTEFGTARVAFDFGVVTILLATLVRTWTVFGSTIALPVTGVIGMSAVIVGVFYARVGNISEGLRPLLEASQAWHPWVHLGAFSQGIRWTFSAFMEDMLVHLRDILIYSRHLRQ